jgi:hypothetical protein
MQKRLDNSFGVSGCGAARFLSIPAFRANEDLARREYAAIVAFRADLAGGMPLDDAESVLRMDLHELAIDDEDFIQSILNNPGDDPVCVYASASDL